MTTETIDGTQLSTYGLRLSHISGHLDLPPYKKILEEHDFEAEMCITQEKRVTVRFIGKYLSKNLMAIQLSAFKTKIASGVKLNWKFDNHYFDENCVVKDGFQVNIINDYVATVTVILTIAGA
jgi:hypothetical protein